MSLICLVDRVPLSCCIKRISAEEEILKDERSSKSFAFPSALFWQSDVTFSQCVIWWQQGAHEKGTNCIQLPDASHILAYPSSYRWRKSMEISGSQIDFTIFFFKQIHPISSALRQMASGSCSMEMYLGGKMAFWCIPTNGWASWPPLRVG